MGWSLNVFMIGNLVINIRLLAMMIFKDIMSTVRYSLIAYRMSQRRKRMTPRERALEDDIANEKMYGNRFSEDEKDLLSTTDVVSGISNLQRMRKALEVKREKVMRELQQEREQSSSGTTGNTLETHQEADAALNALANGK